MAKTETEQAEDLLQQIFGQPTRWASLTFREQQLARFAGIYHAEVQALAEAQEVLKREHRDLTAANSLWRKRAQAIEDMFDGEEDIDGNGNPNRAMRVLQYLRGDYDRALR